MQVDNDWYCVQYTHGKSRLCESMILMIDTYLTDLRCTSPLIVVSVGNDDLS